MRGVLRDPVTGAVTGAIDSLPLNIAFGPSLRLPGAARQHARAHTRHSKTVRHAADNVIVANAEILDALFPGYLRLK
jgi:hypothetical protein